MKIEELPAHRDETQEPATPVCCNSGCTVCVLDFPELFAVHPAGSPEGDVAKSDLLAMVEAIEAAEETAGRLLLSSSESDR